MNGPVTPADDPRPWRKRRPVLSRVVLYAVGIALAGVLFALLSQRSSEDDQDRIDILRKRLRGMPATLIPVPGGHKEILRILATDDFTDPGLPNDVKSLVERTRAMALRRDLSDPEQTMQARNGIDAALELAKKLAPAQEQQALRLEWAEARLEMGVPEGVHDLLNDPSIQWTAEPARILRNYLEAVALATDGDKIGAARHANAYLGALQAPLPMKPTLEAGGRPWSSAEAALQGTVYLARIRAGQNDPRIWERVLRLAPALCLAHVRAASGLAAMGFEKMALSAWERALALDKDEAQALVERDPVMRDLQKLLVKTASSLKSPTPDGR